MPPSKSRKKTAKQASTNKAYKTGSGKSLTKDGINFVAMLLGCVVTAIAILLLLNFLNTKPVEAPAPATAPVAVTSRLPVSILKATGLRFQKMLETDDLDTLKGYFFEIDRVASDETVNEKTDIQRMHKRQVDVTARLLRQSSKLDKELKYQVVTKRIASLAVLDRESMKAESRDPKHNRELQLMRSEFSDDADQRIAVYSQAVLAALEASDVGDNVDPVAERLYRLGKKYPEDSLVHQTIRLSVVDQIKRGHRKTGIRIAESILSKIEVSEFVEFTELSNVFQELRDWKSLSDEKFFETWESRTFNGKVGYEQLSEVGARLCQINSGGHTLLDHIDQIAKWFERQGEFGFGLSIYQKLIDVANGYELPSVGKRAKVLGEFGLRRCELVGSVLQLKGTKYDDSSFDETEFKDQVVVVAFFSLADREFRKKLRFIQQERRQWAGKPVREIAVCIDRPKVSPSGKTQLEQLEQVAKLLPGWLICKRDPQGDLPIFDQCPSEVASRVMLLDRNHRVVEIDILPRELRSQIRFALDAKE